MIVRYFSQRLSNIRLCATGVEKWSRFLSISTDDDKSVRDLPMDDLSSLGRKIKTLDMGDVASMSGDNTFGVFSKQENDDISMLVENYTVPALARALRERETSLQRAAQLYFDGADNGMPLKNEEMLSTLLYPFKPESVHRRRRRDHTIDLKNGFTRKSLVVLQRYLHRMPRQVFHASEKRASVVIPLCNVNGIASVLFTRRSTVVKSHKSEVCFPGGMVEEGVDATIIQTSLREMEEEIGMPVEKTEVLGILRCKWGEVAGMTGVAVTPVIGYIGELNDRILSPNPDEVEQLFTIPISDLMDASKWTQKDFSTPAFHGGPFLICKSPFLAFSQPIHTAIWIISYETH
jgi:8-oxo-dGTP pyrophosphatase MutT (NUDIX family)